MCALCKLRSAWASTQSDQSLHCPHEEILDPWAHSEDSDQTGRIPGLICVCAVRTSHFVCFVILRLNCFVHMLPKIKIVISYVPQNCLCVPVPLFFQTLVPLFPWNKCHRGGKSTWSDRDSNPGPLAYRTSTLTTELPSHRVDLWQFPPA